MKHPGKNYANEFHMKTMTGFKLLTTKRQICFKEKEPATDK